MATCTVDGCPGVSFRDDLPCQRHTLAHDEQDLLADPLLDGLLRTLRGRDAAADLVHTGGNCYAVGWTRYNGVAVLASSDNTVDTEDWSGWGVSVKGPQATDGHISGGLGLTRDTDVARVADVLLDAVQWALCEVWGSQGWDDRHVHVIPSRCRPHPAFFMDNCPDCGTAAQFD